MRAVPPAWRTTINRISPGDDGALAFHAGWTIHGAAANPTATLRAVMTVIYFADGARVACPSSEARRLDHRVWLAGIEPGQAAAGPKNPLLWPRD